MVDSRVWEQEHARGEGEDPRQPTGFGVSPAWVNRAAASWLDPMAEGVLLGPEDAGKTSLLAALQAACKDPSPGPLLSLVPGARLAHLTSTGISGPDRETNPYSFQLHAHGPDGAVREPGYAITVVDTPGRVLFDPQADWAAEGSPPAELLSGLRDTTWLLLAVDSMTYQPGLWSRRLPQLVAYLARERPGKRVLLPGPAAKSHPHSFHPPMMPELRLPHERALVLLTKFDLYAASCLADLRRAPRHELDLRARGLAEEGTAKELALAIDPVQTAQQLLGGGLGVLRSALAPEAQLAVVPASATGFRDEFGRTQPFGLRQALAFLATGERARPLALVRSLNDLNPARWNGRSNHHGA